MTSQIFKNKIPNEFLFEFLEKICFKMENCYILNNDSFKKGFYNEDIKKFFEFCRPYYFISKRKYLDRKITFNNFITIIRQICNYNNIIYSSEIKYNKSNYSMIYYIFFDSLIENNLYNNDY